MNLRRSVLLRNLKETLDPRNFFLAPLEIASFMRELKRFKRRYTGNYPIRLLPVLYERNKKSFFDPHYVYQAYWAAREITHWPPSGQHVDISSHVPFAVQLSAVFPVIQLEFRPPQIEIASFQKISGDILQLPFRDGSLSSISCLHVVEHLGLGRYGDVLDPDGWWKGLGEIQRVLAPNGNLFLSVPVGCPALYFNGNYVFRAADIEGALRELGLISFAYVNDDGGFVESGKFHDTEKMSYALGLFHFRKPPVFED
jgi:SAM-dependent methyltransferase